MSSISSVSSGSSWMYAAATSSGARASQRPDPSKMVDNLFSKLDTSNQGYLTETDLQSAFSQIGSSGSTDTSTSASDVFKQLDSDSNGKVTKEEMTSSLKKLADQLDSQYDSLRTSGASGMAGGMQGAGGMPPPPPPSGGGKDGGLSKDEMTSMASNISSTDSTLASQITNAANNFDAADTNEDGKVSFAETMAYAQKTQESSASTSSTSSTTAATDSTSSISSSTASNEAKILKKLMDLMHAYSNFGSSNGQDASQNVTSLLGSISTSA